MKTERVPAKNVQPGDRLVAADGKPVVVSENRAGRGFRVALAGHQDRFAREIIAGGNLEIMHPEEVVERIVA